MWSTMRSHTRQALEEEVDVESLVNKRVGPGILVLAAPLRLVHMNQAAWELIQKVGHHVEPGSKGETHTAAKGLLPSPLRQICLEIFQHLRARPHAKDWERFELKRVIGLPDNPVLIRGFGAPEDRGRDRSRVVLLLEEVARRREELRQDVIQRFQLTEREQAVVQCLGKGWTNKEIAASLHLALPTVKEHIRHIMEKTKTNTRTGILVRVLGRLDG